MMFIISPFILSAAVMMIIISPLLGGLTIEVPTEEEETE
jgi:hypothetical protein